MIKNGFESFTAQKCVKTFQLDLGSISGTTPNQALGNCIGSSYRIINCDNNCFGIFRSTYIYPL